MSLWSLRYSWLRHMDRRELRMLQYESFLWRVRLHGQLL